MTQQRRPKGRPKKYSEYDQILQDYPAKSMTKRPVYRNSIGVFRGKNGDTVSIKVFFRDSGKSKEIPKGKLSSWTWAELEAERDKLQGRADRGEPLEDKLAPTFEAYAAEWLEIAKAHQKSWQSSMYSVTRQLTPFFGKKRLDEITVRDVNLWQAKRLQEVKPSTVQRDMNILKSILNAALREELIVKNPCAGANKIKGIKARMRYWTMEELAIILKVAGTIDPEFRDYLLWASYSAMRRGEINSMVWDDVKHLDSGEIKVLIPIDKADKGRLIPCNSYMVEILTRQRKRVPQEDSRVFALSYRTIGRRMEVLQKRCEEIGIKDIRLHDLRTFNITNALLSGVDPKTLTGITGHADLQMIQKHYSVVVDKAVNEASQRSGDYISKMLEDADQEKKSNVVNLKLTAKS